MFELTPPGTCWSAQLKSPLLFSSLHLLALETMGSCMCKHVFTLVLAVWLLSLQGHSLTTVSE